MNEYALPISYLPIQIICLVIFEDILFYVTHRIIHFKWLYKNIHYIHHEWTVPVAIRSQYAHPIEHLLSNVLPVVVLGHLFRLNWICYNIWFNFASINSLLVHSDYKLISFGKEHNLHHRYRNGNYGVTGLIDMFFHTNIKNN